MPNPATTIIHNRLLIGMSNSTLRDQPMFGYAEEDIRQVLNGVKQIVVVPYALAHRTAYAESLGQAFKRLGVPTWNSPHHHPGEETKIIEDAEAIYIGGGNTGRLVANLHALRHADGNLVDQQTDAAHSSLVESIRKKVGEGIPLLGASAGFNVMSCDVRTTNDMHIAVQRNADNSLTSRLDALSLLPPHLSVNPHFIDKITVADEERKKALEVSEAFIKILDHQGESRETRLTEALEMDYDRTILALREGAYVVVHGMSMVLKGKTGGLIFRYGKEPQSVGEDDDLSWLL